MANEPIHKYTSKYSRDYEGHSLGYYGHEYITSSDDFSGKKFAGFHAHAADAEVTYTINCGPPAGGGADVTRTYTKTFTPTDFPCMGRISGITVVSGEIKAYYQAGEAEAQS